MSGSLRARVDALDWDALRAGLDSDGYAQTPPLLDARECGALAALLDDDALFRKRIDMGSHVYGEGAYAYFRYPLPDAVAELRGALYAHLAPLANAWEKRLGRVEEYPASLDAFLKRCHGAGQTRPTPLLLRYVEGGYNRLHRDQYGAIAFPFQVVSCLSEPGRDFDGGELLLVEQRARVQSRGEAIRLERGSLLIFPNGDRPVRGKRGDVRATVRHGLSRLHRGERTALGLIFHDAA